MPSPPVRASGETPSESPDARLPLSTKVAYGAPTFAGAAMVIPIAIHLTMFYSDVVLVPLGLIAIAKAVARAFDAITDPLMGWISDRTRTRFGRRRPYLALGAPLAALAFYAMFAPPESLEPLDAAAWFTATYVLYYIFHTVYQIPHYGLGPELTLDSRERSSLYGWQEGFTLAGTMAAAATPPLFISLAGGPRGGYAAFATVFGCVLVLLYVNLLVRVRERPEFSNRPPNPLVPGVRRVLRNRVFRILLGVYLIASVTGAIPGLMMPYFTKYVLRPEDPDAWLGIFLFIYFGSGFLALPAWVWAARRFGKKPTWLASFVSAITGSAALFFMGEGDLLLTSLILVWSGSSFGARLFLSAAIQADVIDYDELYTGKRREAQYGGLWSVMMKFTVIPSMSIPIAVLGTAGYVPNVEQTETVRFTIQAIFALGPAVFASLAFLVACRYPISEPLHRAIREGIERHRRGERAVDPLSGAVVPPPDSSGVDEDTGWFLDHFSPGELRRYLTGGAERLVRDAVAGAVISLAVLVSAVYGTVTQVSDLSREPGVLAVLFVVVAGFALTGLCFHAVRIRAAQRMRRAPVSVSMVRTHLESAERIRSGGVGEPAAAALRP